MKKISAKKPPTMPPRKPIERNRPWNSPAMKLFEAPMKCSTSTISRLDAIVPRVAKMMASTVATTISAEHQKAGDDDGAGHGVELLAPGGVGIEARALHRHEVALKLFDVGVHRVGELDDDEARDVDRA